MKFFIRLFFFLLSASPLITQAQITFEKDTVEVNYSENADQYIDLNIKVANALIRVGSNQIVRFLWFPTTNPLLPLSSYELGPETIRVNRFSSSVRKTVKLMAGIQSTDKFIGLILYYGIPEVRDTCVIKVKVQDKPKSAASTTSERFWKRDDGNILKMEALQYTDVSGINNDRPNGLLQYQALIKVPIVKRHWEYSDNFKVQIFRSLIFDGMLNRIDKTKEEVAYDYTSFLLDNNEVKQSGRPWLATTDLIRYSSFQLGAKVALANVDFGEFRVYFDAGIQLIQNRPFKKDSFEVSPGVFEQRSDFRSVYSRANYVEMFTKTLRDDGKVDLSFTLGYRWIKLLDSYYQQITILQQDPFQKITALQLEGTSPKRGMFYSSFRLGLAVGEEKTVSLFYRMNYSLQTGKYLFALEQPVVGQSVRFEERRFYNNFFQIHVGATISFTDLFVKKKEAKAKEGLIMNSVN